jgi:hypothetical protein
MSSSQGNSQEENTKSQSTLQKYKYWIIGVVVGVVVVGFVAYVWVRKYKTSQSVSNSSLVSPDIGDTFQKINLKSLGGNGSNSVEDIMQKVIMK